MDGVGGGTGKQTADGKLKTLLGILHNNVATCIRICLYHHLEISTVFGPGIVEVDVR